MDKEYSKKLQDFVINYYRSRCDKPLWVSSEFCCSEMARYLGYIVLKDLLGAKAHILKGIISKDLSHDVLLISYNNQFIMIDPTVWQFFRNKKSIFIGNFKDLKASINAAEKIYKGTWSVSEELSKNPLEKELSGLIDIIDENINKNCE